MGGARAWARAIRRRHRAGLLLLVVLGGLGLGLVAVATTGAARARTAYDRLNAETLGPDGFGDASGLDDAGFDHLHSLPGVEGFARFALIENERRIAQGIRNLKKGLPKLG